jgi:hypothetical protein
MPSFNKDNYQDITIRNGAYPFTVINASLQESKAGNEMIWLELQVDVGNRYITVFDRLVFTDKALGFIKRFCEATGLEHLWESGKLEPEDCIGAGGMVQIEKGDQYMEVAYYLRRGEKPKFVESPKAKAEPVTNPMGVSSTDDDIPF